MIRIGGEKDLDLMQIWQDKKLTLGYIRNLPLGEKSRLHTNFNQNILFKGMNHFYYNGQVLDSFFHKNNFIRTKTLILTKKIRTGYEQTQACCFTERKSKVSALVILSHVQKYHMFFGQIVNVLRGCYLLATVLWKCKLKW